MGTAIVTVMTVAATWKAVVMVMTVEVRVTSGEISCGVGGASGENCIK